MKKYEISLPLKYNDGREIEAEKIKQIREELIAVFGALIVSSQFAPYQGSWKCGGVDFIDDIIKIEIIAGADRKTERFFRGYKKHLGGTILIRTVYLPPYSHDLLLCS